MAAPSPVGRERAKALLRRLHLLTVVDRVRLQLWRRRMRAANAAFTRDHPGFAVPPPELAFDAYGHVDWTGYLRSGEQQASAIAEVVAALIPSGPLTVLEWGCGPGRVIRHLPRLLGQRAKVIGADYNEQSIAWDRENLAGITFHVNGLAPPLELPDASVDVAVAISVVTHLSESMQLAWAREIRRVLRPGGFWLCTTQGEAFARMLANPKDRVALAEGEPVTLAGDREGKKYFLALQPERYVRERLLVDFVGVRRLRTSRMELDFFEQDTWIAWRDPVPRGTDEVLAGLVSPSSR